ncbi:MAG: amidohydrolase family protein [Candidatus Bathyarchaeota archaeon]|nr:amidohydrolase family protein [Candidatus Bathyarchaeota archaeon]
MSKNLVDELGAGLVLLNGKIITVDPSETIAEAVAVRDGRFLKVGSSEEIRRLAGSKTRVIDLKGKTVLPGFIDSHEHCIRKGMRGDWVDCTSPPMATIDQLVEALAAKASEKAEGEWVVGYGFDETKLEDRRWPNRYDLDRASSRHPVYLGRAGGHNAVANSMALEIAGVTKDTPQPPGANIGKDDSGEPTGRLDEVAAMNMVRGKIPAPTDEEAVEIMVENWPAVEEELLDWGLTTIHEAHIKTPEALAYQELLKEGKLRLRAGLMLDGMAPYGGYATSDLARQGLRTGFGWSDRLYVIGVKLGVDGAMGSLTASLTKPYANDPGNYGINRVTQEELTEETVRLHQAGNRACIHAIGDWAIDIALNAVEEAVKSRKWDDHRHRIEHAGYVRPDQLDRMARLGVAVSASIGFCHPIGDSHIDALGEERLVGYYPMRSFKEHGIVAAGNSDGFGKNWAITGIHGCVTRKSSTGRSLAEEQAIPMMDAIRAYTINAAYLEGKEDEKGSIEPGKLADMVVLDRDFLTVDSGEIIETRALMTIVGGEVVYERE